MTAEPANQIGQRRRQSDIGRDWSNYARPQTVADALDLLSKSQWRILAGGTDFYPAQRDRPVRDAVLDITGLQDLRAISLTDGHWRIGATATWCDLQDAGLPPAFFGLKLAAREVGSIQIQTRATIVGNICNASPAADGVPPLLTLDASVEIASQRGVRLVPLHEFITGNRQTLLLPDELVTAVLVPEASARGGSSFLKLGSRRYLVISIVMIACRLAAEPDGRIDAAAVSVGACSAVARRLPEFEARLIGQPVDQVAGVAPVDADLDGLTPIDDVRASADYRMSATKELITHSVIAAAKEA